MVWFQCPQTKEWELGYKPTTHVLCDHGRWKVAEYYPSLTFLDALALLEEAGWFWHKLDGEKPWKAHKPWPAAVVEAATLGELLDKIREAEEEKHG